VMVVTMSIYRHAVEARSTPSPKQAAHFHRAMSQRRQKPDGFVKSPPIVSDCGAIRFSAHDFRRAPTQGRPNGLGSIRSSSRHRTVSHTKERPSAIRRGRQPSAGLQRNTGIRLRPRLERRSPMLAGDPSPEGWIASHRLTELAGRPGLVHSTAERAQVLSLPCYTLLKECALNRC
jgi:hypothetical protein